MEGRETDLEYNLLMGLTGASVSKHLLDEHFTLLWANDFYYDMIGYPKEEYEALFHNKPDLYFKGYDEAWNILSKNVYETIANKAISRCQREKEKEGQKSPQRLPTNYKTASLSPIR